MGKNILIFADGTGNEGGLLPDESRTNVYKLQPRSAEDAVRRRHRIRVLTVD
jgi:hypothetical protein